MWDLIKVAEQGDVYDSDDVLTDSESDGSFDESREVLSSAFEHSSLLLSHCVQTRRWCLH